MNYTTLVSNHLELSSYLSSYFSTVFLVFNILYPFHLSAEIMSTSLTQFSIVSSQLLTSSILVPYLHNIGLCRVPDEVHSVKDGSRSPPKSSTQKEEWNL